MSLLTYLGNERLRERFPAPVWTLFGFALLLVAGPVWSQSRPEPVAPRGRLIDTAVLDVDQASAESTKIARGTLGDSTTAWVGRKIYTFYDLIVSETIKGESETKITVAVPGGSKGKVASIWAGAPKLATGDEIVFFGKRFGQGPAFVAHGLFSGFLQVRTDPVSGRSVVGTHGPPEDVEEFLNDVRSRR